MSGPYTRDTREVIVERSNRNSGTAMIIAIAIVAIVVVGLAIVFLGHPSGTGSPAGGGGTTTSEPGGNATPAATQAAPTEANPNPS